MSSTLSLRYLPIRRLIDSHLHGFMSREAKRWANQALQHGGLKTLRFQNLVPICVASRSTCCVSGGMKPLQLQLLVFNRRVFLRFRRRTCNNTVFGQLRLIPRGQCVDQGVPETGKVILCPCGTPLTLCAVVFDSQKNPLTIALQPCVRPRLRFSTVFPTGGIPTHRFAHKDVTPPSPVFHFS